MRSKVILNNGVGRIAQERTRQIEEEGFDSAHDDRHIHGEMAKAAACHAVGANVYFAPILGATSYRFQELWPLSWPKSLDHRGRSTRIRQLEIAGALAAAEIDRLLRLERRERIEKAIKIANPDPNTPDPLKCGHAWGPMDGPQDELKCGKCGVGIMKFQKMLAEHNGTTPPSPDDVFRDDRKALMG